MTRRVVVDANRIYSALVREGATRRAMMESADVLFAPHFLRTEIESHKAEIAERAGTPMSEIEEAIGVLYRRLRWVSGDEIAPHMDAANDALAAVDPDDAAYLACALAVGADAIWSHDRDFDKQSLVPRVEWPLALE